MKIILLLFTCLVLPLSAKPGDRSEKPTDPKQQATSWLVRNLKDYESARIKFYPQLAEYEYRPFDDDIVVIPTWMFKADINAKNSYGGYSGWADYRFLFVKGKLLAVLEYHAETGKYERIEAVVNRN